MSKSTCNTYSRSCPLTIISSKQVYMFRSPADKNLSLLPHSGYIPFMTNYEYCCASCGTESILKKPASKWSVLSLLPPTTPISPSSLPLSHPPPSLPPPSHCPPSPSHHPCFPPTAPSFLLPPPGFIQVMITTLANLKARHASDQPPKTFFSLEDVYTCVEFSGQALIYSSSPPPSSFTQEIIPYVWDRWDIICTKRSKTGSWRTNLSTKLVRTRPSNHYHVTFMRLPLPYAMVVREHSVILFLF